MPGNIKLFVAMSAEQSLSQTWLQTVLSSFSLFLTVPTTANEEVGATGCRQDDGNSGQQPEANVLALACDGLFAFIADLHLFSNSSCQGIEHGLSILSSVNMCVVELNMLGAEPLPSHCWSGL